jgi:hypothetical protein
MSSTFVVTLASKMIRSNNIRPCVSYMQNLKGIQLFGNDCALQQRRSDSIGTNLKHISNRRYVIGSSGPLRCKSCSMSSKLGGGPPKQKQYNSDPYKVLFSSISDDGTGSKASGDNSSNSEALSKGQNVDLSTTPIKSKDTNKDVTTQTFEPSNETRNNNNHGQNSNPSFKVCRVSYKTGTMYVK